VGGDFAGVGFGVNSVFELFLRHGWSSGGLNFWFIQYRKPSYWLVNLNFSHLFLRCHLA
jgi:hypothetical protein